MLIAGEWQVGDDGVVRPIVHARITAADGNLIAEDFLIDSGADRTAFSAALMARLQLPTRPEAPEFALVGIGGVRAFELITTVLEFLTHEGGVARVRGEFAGFTDMVSPELSILGRDVLDHFDLLLSRRRNEIWLLAPRHRYRVERMI